MLLLCSTPAWALSVLDAWSLALENDPTFQAAVQEKVAGDENKNIGRAGLLPTVSVNYRNGPRNWQTATSERNNLLTGQAIETTTRQQYSSYSGSVTVTQPLFDYSAWARYKAGVAQTFMSDERYRAKFLELSVRVIGTYVEAAYARDKIALLQAQKATLYEQMTQNQRLLAAGEGTVTDISETEARYRLAQAQEIEARDALDVAQRQLETIIGIPVTGPDMLQMLRPGKFSTEPLRPARFEAWQALALKNNPQLAASRYGIDAAKYEIENNRGRFMPQVALYATHSENDSSSDNTINQQYRTDSIGVQVSMELYSGGRDIASVRQAAARYKQAKYEMDAQAGATLVDLRKQFNASTSSRAKLAAYELAVTSARSVVEATRKSVLAGQRVNLDVLNAQQQLYRAQEDLAGAKYAYIKSWVALLNGSGSLSEKDIRRVAAWFE
ncbi:TolC family outer membrane protein [Enterobacteriaceae bacterium 4M9]|nr:TolC family outer membrane protein [Enterobacteriaceae bacterium 4M9]